MELSMTGIQYIRKEEADWNRTDWWKSYHHALELHYRISMFTYTAMTALCYVNIKCVDEEGQGYIMCRVGGSGIYHV